MDKCEEMRAQFDRFCEGQLADSGTTQIQAISSLQMKNIRKYFVPGIYSFDIVGFLDTTLLKTGAQELLDALREIAAQYGNDPDEDDEDEA